MITLGEQRINGPNQSINQSINPGKTEDYNTRRATDERTSAINQSINQSREMEDRTLGEQRIHGPHH